MKNIGNDVICGNPKCNNRLKQSDANHLIDDRYYCGICYGKEITKRQGYLRDFNEFIKREVNINENIAKLVVDGVNKLKNDLNIANQEKDKYKKRCNQVEKERNKLSSESVITIGKIIPLKSDLENKNTEISSIKKQCDILKTKNIEITSKYEAEKQENKKLQNDINNSKIEITKLTGKRDYLIQELNLKEINNEEIVNNLKNKYETEEKKNNILKENIDNLNRKIKELEEKNRNNDNIINDLNIKYETEKQKNDEYQAREILIKNENVEYKKQNDNLNAELLTLRNTKITIDDNVKLQQELNSVININKEWENSYNNLKNSYNELHKKVDTDKQIAEKVVKEKNKIIENKNDEISNFESSNRDKKVLIIALSVILFIVILMLSFISVKYFNGDNVKEKDKIINSLIDENKILNNNYNDLIEKNKNERNEHINKVTNIDQNYENQIENLNNTIRDNNEKHRKELVVLEENYFKDKQQLTKNITQLEYKLAIADEKINLYKLRIDTISEWAAISHYRYIKYREQFNLILNTYKSLEEYRPKGEILYETTKNNFRDSIRQKRKYNVFNITW